jgi:hypothetical protein
MKCECVSESRWFCIDDSFSKNSEIGGEFIYLVGKIYNFTQSDGPFGRSYMVRHDKHGEIGFDEGRFNDTFKIINDDV